MNNSSLGFGGVDLGNRDSASFSNVIHSLGVGDDSDALGNGLGSDWMVTSNHDNL